MNPVLNFIVSHVGQVIATAGAGLASLFVAKWFGPKVLAKVVTNRSRAQLLDDCANAVVNFLAPAIKATPNKYDDVALAVLEAIRDWADKEVVTFSTGEIASAHAAAMTKLADNLAFNGALDGTVVGSKLQSLVSKK